MTNITTRTNNGASIKMSNNDVWIGFLKRKCFYNLSRRRKVGSDGAETTYSGSSFQIRGPKTSKTRLPTVDSLKVVGVESVQHWNLLHEAALTVTVKNIG